MNDNSKVKDAMKNCMQNELWSAQNSLNVLEEELIKIKHELIELNGLYTSYFNLRTQFHNKYDEHCQNLIKLESIGEKSKSAQTYSECFRNKLYGVNAINGISEFDGLDSFIKKLIEDRENRVEDIRQQQNALEYKIYSANNALRELEDSYE